jgi:hypothetical protein
MLISNTMLQVDAARSRTMHFRYYSANNAGANNTMIHFTSFTVTCARSRPPTWGLYCAVPVLLRPPLIFEGSNSSHLSSDACLAHATTLYEHCCNSTPHVCDTQSCESAKSTATSSINTKWADTLTMSVAGIIFDLEELHIEDDVQMPDAANAAYSAIIGPMSALRMNPHKLKNKSGSVSKSRSSSSNR